MNIGGLWGGGGEGVKSLKLRFHTNKARSEAIMCFPLKKKHRNQHLRRMESRTVQRNQGIKKI